MRITNKELLVNFVKKHPDTSSSIIKWVESVSNTEWKNHADIKKTYPSADYVGNERYVFNIKGNNYRLVVVVVFLAGSLTIRFAGTHADYDKIKNCSTI